MRQVTRWMRALRRSRLNPFLWARWLRRTAAVVLVLACVAGLVTAGIAIRQAQQACAPGVTEQAPSDECVGVTDGEYSFAPELDAVSARIKAENDRVANAGSPSVTVAFVIPMRPTDKVEREQTLREVQGAYLAQYRANHEANRQQPAIRLVLANPGRDSAHWRPVAEQIVAMAHDPDQRLRLVAGFNASVRNTADALRYLTGEGIPVVAGPLTADDTGNSAQRPDAYPGLVKVVPGNRDQAAALAAYNRDIDPVRTLLVEDLRKGDNYVDSLREVFRDHTADARYASEHFTSPSVTEVGTTPNQFKQMVNTICTSQARWIYFAGRPVHLRVFVNALGERGCTNIAFTVLTGSGASTLANDSELNWDALNNGITVQYTAIAHPNAWSSPDRPKTGGSQEDYQRLVDLAAKAGQIGEVNFTDSRTITMYDAVWTGITGIRTAKTGEVPSLQGIIDIWPRLHGPNRVNGASGWICLDNHGNAYNKAVAVVTLSPRSRNDIVFQGVAWPQMRQPEPECLVPNPTK